MTDDENVWCIMKESIQFDGVAEKLNHFYPRAQVYLNELMDYKMLVPRSKCETDEGFLQLIPYIAVVCGDYVMAYQRVKAGESRLDGKWSIGFGGHINDGDDSYFDGAVREGREELTGFRAECLGPAIGFIYDSSNPVGRVHLGVLHVYDFAKSPVVPTEVPSHRWILARNVYDWVTAETWSMYAGGMIQESRGGK